MYELSYFPCQSLFDNDGSQNYFIIQPQLTSLALQKVISDEYVMGRKTLREKCWYSELFWSVFCRIRTECGQILRIPPYSVRMQEKTDQKNSKYGHFLRSEFQITMRLNQTKTGHAEKGFKSFAGYLNDDDIKSLTIVISKMS